jgi:hypothetical protein
MEEVEPVAELQLDQVVVAQPDQAEVQLLDQVVLLHPDRVGVQPQGLAPTVVVLGSIVVTVVVRITTTAITMVENIDGVGSRANALNG